MARTAVGKKDDRLIPPAVLHVEMAEQLAALYADHADQVPPQRQGQPVDAEAIKTWSELDVVTWWIRGLREHGDRLGFDWPDIYDRHHDAIEAHRIAIEAEFGKRSKVVGAEPGTSTRPRA